jgi:hypothetical protein
MAIPSPSESGRASRRADQSLTSDPVQEAVAAFGAAVARKWGRGGDPEDQLRAPVEELLRRVGSHLRVDAVPYGEVRLRSLRARPDYAVDVGGRGMRAGYVELKQPDARIPPHWRPRARDRAQWEKLSSLPNVLYTNGTTWTRCSLGVVAETVDLVGSVTDSRLGLHADGVAFTNLIANFLFWNPESPRSLAALIDVTAGLCNLLRDDVTAVLSGPQEQPGYEDLTLLADDWRTLLFPDLDDQGFADAYAQTVTFALLLAGLNGIKIADLTVSEIAKPLSRKHMLIGQALGVLTHGDAADELRTIDTLRRVIGAVAWDSLTGQADAYETLYERFLSVYDASLRRRSGSYYTPQAVAASMVDLVATILRDRLKQSAGFASDGVVAVDPAMGTGTFLVEILRSVAEEIDARQGRGARGPKLREFFAERLVGFEIQAAPYAVTELRLHQALTTEFDCDLPTAEARFLTDALESPAARDGRLAAAHRVIGQSKKAANRIKRDVRVMVVIGNPPHVENTKGLAPWVERRRRSPLVPGQQTSRPSLDEFRAAGKGRYESDLYGLPWCFWRWAIWKAFEAHADSPAGVIAFLSPSSFLHGKSFAGMREYLRRICDEGWVIELSPEGNRPPPSSRLFGDAGRQLCIAIFARYQRGNHAQPAVIHNRRLDGSAATKIAALRAITLDDDGWNPCSDGWQEPFDVAPRPEWSDFVPVSEIFPWTSRGVTAGRTWVYAPEQATLHRRWDRLIAADHRHRADLFVESRDRTVERAFAPLPGFPPAGPLAAEDGTCPPPIRVAYRSFDRQWMIPDSRLFVMPRPPLWEVRSDRQIYITEQSNHPISSGPALTFTELIPDIDHYNVRSGRVLPLFRDRVAATANIAPGLVDLLQQRLAAAIEPEDLLAYVAAITAHDAYTRQFSRDLTTPGVRVPLTADAALWRTGVEIGRQVLWLHTFGTRCVDESAGRPLGLGQLMEECGPRVLREIPDTREGMPTAIDFDSSQHLLLIGEGAVGPVSDRTYQYDVAGMRVVRHWFDYRCPTSVHRRRSSLLDDIAQATWTPERTTELLQLLTVIDRCIQLEPSQAELLAQVHSGPLITRSDLVGSGLLPVSVAATRPPARRLNSDTLF